MSDENNNVADNSGRRLVSDPEEILEWLRQPNHLIDGTEDQLKALNVLDMWISNPAAPTLFPEASASFSAIKDMLNKGLLELEIRFRRVFVRLSSSQKSHEQEGTDEQQVQEDQLRQDGQGEAQAGGA